MSPQCTPLKHAYDQCFNSWFEGYLQPAIGDSANPAAAASSFLDASSSTSKNTKNGDRQAASSKEQERAYSKRKAEEFEEQCGKVWESYRTCIAVSLAHYSVSELTHFTQKAVTEKGLDTLLDQARRDNPLRDPEPPVPSPTASTSP